MRRLLSGLAMACAAACLVACAGSGKSIRQAIRVETPGCALASCTLGNDRGTWLVLVTPGETVVTTSSAPLKVVCKSAGGPDSSVGAPSSSSGTDGSGAVAGAAVGGVAAGAAFGSVALSFIPVLGVIIVASAAAVGMAGGSALEASQQTLAYPPVISVAMSCPIGHDTAGVSSAGRFGVGFRGLSPAEVEATGTGGHAAVLVTDVASGGVADLAGLRKGDLVLAADGREIVEAAQLERLAAQVSPGHALRLRVWRGDREVELSLLLVAGKR